MIKPLNTNILVELQELPNKTESGIYIPDAAKSTGSGLLTSGKVLAVNKDCEDIKIGDIVLFNKHSGNVVPNDKNLKLVRTEDVYGII